MIPRLKANAVLRVLTHGRTSPCVVLASDAEGETHEVVIKWRSGPEQKDIGGICELACSLLADDLGLPTPQPSLVEIDEEFLFDHEQAFSFVRGVLFWKPAWAGGEVKHFREHIFFDQLKRTALNLNRLNGALAELSDKRLAEYADAIPDGWKSDNDAIDKILDYLRSARENRTALFAVINEMLK